MKLWDKGGESDADVLAYTARDDYILDQQLLPFDLRASIAHVRGLCRIGALEPDERDRIVAVLEDLVARAEQGAFTIPPDAEDGHTAIEAELVARLGDTGKRVHLGRSRNDQVLVALRLLLRDALTAIAELEGDAAAAMISLARKKGAAIMPGYTHMQRAVPQTFGHHALGIAEGFVDSIEAAVAARKLCDRSPLGAAAGYGVNLPLDREGVAHELGFEDIVINPAWSQSSRGITETFALSAVWHGMAVVRRLAWDLSLFSTTEFGFVTLPQSFTTGSSIMPNKRNPDVIELMRASAAIVQGAITELTTIAALPSGYHRDLQLTKAPLLRALAEAKRTLALVPKLAEKIEIHEARMRAAVTSDMLSTDRAVELARAGVPFRDAYRQAARDLKEGEASPAEVEASIRARVSLGAPGNLAIDRIEGRLVRLLERVRSSAGPRSG